MNRRQTLEILSILQINYPQSFRGWTDDDREHFVSLWAQAFNDKPVEIVTEAVKNIVYHSDREFAPNIGQVNTEIMNIARRSATDSTAAWNILRDFMRHMDCNYLEDSREAYDKLPEEIKAMYTLQDIAQLAHNSSVDNDQYVKPQFMKNYEKVQGTIISRQFEKGNFTAITGPKGEKLKIGFKKMPDAEGNTGG